MLSDVTVVLGMRQSIDRVESHHNNIESSVFFPVENPDHCEFSNLRDMLIRTHLQDLKDVTHSIHYENFRYERLQARQKYDKVDESRCWSWINTFYLQSILFLLWKVTL